MSEPIIRWHVAGKTSLKSILANGLVPKSWPRSSEFGESWKAVFLFRSEDEAADAVSGWLGDSFPEDETLVLLRVDVSGVELEEEAFETRVRSTVPPDRISVFNGDF